MRICCAVVLAGVILPFAAVRADSTATPAATATPASLPPGLAVIHDWLVEFDAGQFERCWKEGGKVMHDAVSLDKSIAHDKNQAQKFGLCTERRLTGARHHDRLKLADGSAINAEFIEAQFSTDFQNEKNVTESVSSMKEADGAWRVIAYDARPARN